MRFTKMHGCGNDYVYLDAFRDDLPADLPELARLMSHRHFGVGSDGLVVVGPSKVADAKMTMFNLDGSLSEMCGNALRCVARLAYDRGYLSGSKARFETGAGILPVAISADDVGVHRMVQVRMGLPRLTPAEVPVVHEGPGPRLDLSLTIDGYEQPFDLIAVGMGNPHAICFVNDAETAPVHEAGAKLEVHEAFPNRTNVEFVSPLPADSHGRAVLRQRTWERGCGETWACGTGASAVAVAAILAGRAAAGDLVIRLNGGDLIINWDGSGEVHMTGPADYVFEGEWPEA